MNAFRRFSRLLVWMVLGMMSLVYQNFLFSWSLNDEGIALLRFAERVANDPFGALSSWTRRIGEADPCSWFGVECAEGNVVSLNVKDLCLEGTLAPEIVNLSQIKSIVLRNNSFSGVIPQEIGELKKLEMLDLSYNNFSSPLPTKLANCILLVDNNELFLQVSPKLKEYAVLSEIQMDENHLEHTVEGSPHDRRLETSSTTADNWKEPLPTPFRVMTTAVEEEVPNAQAEDKRHGKKKGKERAASPRHHPSDTPTSTPPLPSPEPSPSPKSSALASPPPTSLSKNSKSSKNHLVLIMPAAVGGFAVVTLILCVFLWRSKKIVTFGPWATGLSGQPQKASVAGADRTRQFNNGKTYTSKGVRKLKRSELEIACEDFSNVICSSSIGTIYKGILSDGIEMAVMSYAVSSTKDWSNNLETQFRKKIDTLSKLSHKNFINLLGYCEEKEPFTRILVFEYAPNGTLFEHLHIKEAEHLDWGMRLRIAMDMAYCLKHMHQLSPPIVHGNLNSSSVNLAEDYAAKISDFSFWDETIVGISTSTNTLTNRSASLEDDVYSFGMVLLEMMTGQLPYSVDCGSLEDGSSHHLLGQKPVEEMIDPMLRYFDPQQAEMISEVIRGCVHPDLQQRPTMREVTVKLEEITVISSTPKVNPLLLAHLELQSINGS